MPAITLSGAVREQKQACEHSGSERLAGREHTERRSPRRP
jgi:hypothetical protein